MWQTGFAQVNDVGAKTPREGCWKDADIIKGWRVKSHYTYAPTQHILTAWGHQQIPECEWRPANTKLIPPKAFCKSTRWMCYYRLTVSIGHSEANKNEEKVHYTYWCLIDYCLTFWVKKKWKFLQMHPDATVLIYTFIGIIGHEEAIIVYASCKRKPV